MIGTALLLMALAQAPAEIAAAGPASPEAERLREAGQAAMRRWIVCVIDGGKARAAGGTEAREAVAEAQAGCLAERAATGEAIAAAERAAGNEVSGEKLDGLLAELDATVGAGAAVIVGKDGKAAGKRRR